MGSMIEVSIAYASPDRPSWQRLEVAAGSTVGDVVEASGLLARHPELDLSTVKIGVFGRLRAADAPVEAGDRVEVYQPIIADPKTVRRRPRAA